MEKFEAVLNAIPCDQIESCIAEVERIRAQYPPGSKITVGSLETLEQNQCFKMLQAEGMFEIKNLDDPKRFDPHPTQHKHRQNTAGTVFHHGNWDELLEKLKEKKNIRDNEGLGFAPE